MENTKWEAGWDKVWLMLKPEGVSVVTRDGETSLYLAPYFNSPRHFRYRAAILTAVQSMVEDRPRDPQFTSPLENAFTVLMASLERGLVPFLLDGIPKEQEPLPPVTSYRLVWDSYGSTLRFPLRQMEFPLDKRMVLVPRAA